MDWNAMAAPWLAAEVQTEAAHRPVLDALLAQAEVQPGQQVLDIGPGAGLSLIELAARVGPDGHVTGIEIAPPFAARARARVPENVTVIEADAQSHDYPAQTFDIAFSHFGVMFFDDNLAAFRHIRGAMRPGGSLHFCYWGPPALNPWFSTPGRVAAEVFGPGPAPDLAAPGPMRFHDAGALRGLLEAAGWQAEVVSRDLHLTPPGGPEGAADMMMRIGAAAARLRMARDEGLATDAQAEELRARLVAAFAGMSEGGAVRVPARINFASARA